MTENDVRDDLMRYLFQRFGVHESWTGAGSNAEFAVESGGEKGRGRAEEKLNYSLPSDQTLSHCSDVLWTISEASEKPQYISIEIKHASAVTDQFKCRSYDMLHLKQQFGDALYGIMLFARTGKGISFQRAQAICYPFDAFIGVDTLRTPQADWWREVVDVVSRRLRQPMSQNRPIPSSALAAAR